METPDWRQIDIQDTVDEGEKTILQNGRETYRLKSTAKNGGIGKHFSSRHEAFLYASEGGHCLGGVLFPDHFFKANKIEVTMQDASVVATPGLIQMSRDSSFSFNHSFDVPLHNQGTVHFTWGKAKKHGDKKLPRGSLVLTGPQKEHLAIFQTISRGSSAGRLYISPLLGDQLLPLIILTCVGMTAKVARDKDDEGWFSMGVESIAGSL